MCSYLVPPLGRFVCAHLTPHQHKLAHRIADYNHIIGSLLFPPLLVSPSSSHKPSTEPTTIYDTSHLFFFGDLNFRLDLPETHPLYGPDKQQALISALHNESEREELKEYDQLRVEHKKGTAFVGLREGEFWKFKVCLPRLNIQATIRGRFINGSPCSARTSTGLAKSTNTGRCHLVAF